MYNINWNTQITQICKKIFSLIQILNKFKNVLPFFLRKLLVQTLVMPHFDYCDSIY